VCISQFHPTLSPRKQLPSSDVVFFNPHFVKIYVAAAEAKGKKKRGDETSVYYQNWWKN
jgi:hypothetical protein